MKQEKNIKRGKKSRKYGSEFERRVRKDLEEKGWVVDKWGNNVEFAKESIPVQINSPYDKEVVIGRLIPAKNKWNNFTKSMIMGSGGFPDFVAFKHPYFKTSLGLNFWNLPLGAIDISPQFLEPSIIIGVEVKSNGILTKLEKEKCSWLLNNQIFSKILIAKKTKVKNRVVIVYEDFQEKYLSKMKLLNLKIRKNLQKF